MNPISRFSVFHSLLFHLYCVTHSLSSLLVPLTPPHTRTLPFLHSFFFCCFFLFFSLLSWFVLSLLLLLFLPLFLFLFFSHCLAFRHRHISKSGQQAPCLAHTQHSLTYLFTSKGQRRKK